MLVKGGLKFKFSVVLNLSKKLFIALTSDRIEAKEKEGDKSGGEGG